MRTRLRICKKKQNYATREAAILAIEQSNLILRPYKCDRCFQFHLTSRTKGKWMSKPQ